MSILWSFSGFEAGAHFISRAVADMLRVPPNLNFEIDDAEDEWLVRNAALLSFWSDLSSTRSIASTSYIVDICFMAFGTGPSFSNRQ